MPDAGHIFYENGEDRYAPLELDLSGDEHCFFLLREWETGEVVMTFFLPAWDWTEIQVPLGDFQLSYAYGTDWVDEEQLFGPDTRYARMDERFDFYEEDGRVVGWTIRMEADPDTDSTTRAIDEADFWSGLSPVSGL